MQGEVSEIVSKGTSLEMRVTDTERAVGVLESLAFVVKVSREGDVITADTGADHAAEVSRALAEAGVYLTELRPRQDSLEDVFLEITGE
jgi:ABC-2 type transport system ATP-binding protein